MIYRKKDLKSEWKKERTQDWKRKVNKLNNEWDLSLTKKK